MAWLILAWLAAHGYDSVQRDVVFVAARVESGLRPEIRNGPHRGLMQWAGPRAARLRYYERGRIAQLMRDAPGRDLRLAQATAQLEFMDREWRAMPVSARFFRATDRAAAWDVFCAHFLRRRGC